MVNATTSFPTLHYDYSVSNDDDDSERNWFRVDDSYTAKVIATSTSELIPYRSYHETGLSAKYLQVDYTLIGAGGEVYLEVVKQNQIK